MEPVPQARRHRRHRGPDRHAPFHHPSEADPTDPGLIAAAERLDDLFEQLEHIELQVLVVEPPGATRLAARDRAASAAIVAGRHALLDDATTGAREMAMRSYGRSGFSGTWALTDMAMSVAMPGDRIAAAAALEEAAMAAVVEDLVDRDTLWALRSTTAVLFDMAGLPAPGSISNIGTSHGSGRRARGLILVLLAILFIIVVGINTGPRG